MMRHPTLLTLAVALACAAWAPRSAHAQAAPSCVVTTGSHTENFSSTQFKDSHSTIAGWVAPFMAGAHDTKIVFRSHALLHGMYGKMQYSEVIPIPGRVLGFFGALCITCITYCMYWLVLLPPVRAVLQKFMPAPGQGPSEEERKSGFFQVHPPLIHLQLFALITCAS